MNELITQLPNGGAVVAIIVVTWIFLKKQERYEDKMNQITSQYLSELMATRKEFLEHLRNSPGGVFGKKHEP